MEENQDIILMKSLMKPYFEIPKKRFWLDIISSAVFGWGLFIYSCFNPNIFSFLISTLFLYRGTLLIHEVSHLAKKLKGYRLFFNLFFGWPNSFSAYIYDTHLFHHGKRTYATKRDPEYKFISNYNTIMLLRPVVLSSVLPMLQLLRFGLLPFALLLLPRAIKVKVYQRLSTLVFAADYIRPIKNEKEALNQMMRNDLMSSIYKIIFFLLVYYSVLPVVSVYLWFGMIWLSSVLNMYRAIFNHLYSNESEEPLTWEEHLLDTATVEPGVVSTLVLANGLNYHSLHHLFPDLPYTNLGKAHRFLMKELPAEHIYRKTVFKSLFELARFSLSKDRMKQLERYA